MGETALGSGVTVVRLVLGSGNSDCEGCIFGDAELVESTGGVATGSEFMDPVWSFRAGLRYKARKN